MQQVELPVPTGLMILGLRENIWAKDTRLKVISIQVRSIKAIQWKGVTYQENVGKEGDKTQEREFSFRDSIEEEKASLKDTLSKRDALVIIRKPFYSFSSLPVPTIPSV